MQSFKEWGLISEQNDEFEKFLNQDPDTFDQTKDGWRYISGIPNQIKAVEKYLQTYAQNNNWLPTTPKGNTKDVLSIPFMRWHLGQLYAMENNIGKAIENMKKSIGTEDQQWNDYVNATIAFLKNDREEFEKHANKENYNGKTIEKLRNGFGKSYKEAY